MTADVPVGRKLQCVDCPSKCKDHTAEITLTSKYMELKGDPKIQIFVNGFKQIEKPVIQSGKYIFNIKQMNEPEDKIEVKYVSNLCLEPDGFLSYKFNHKCNMKDKDIENISFNIPQDCNSGTCSPFIMKGKVLCSDVPVIKGNIEIVGQSGNSFKTSVNGRGEYSLKVDQYYSKEKFSVIYTYESCYKDTTVFHKCSKDDFSTQNVNLHLDSKCCGDRCRSLINIVGKIEANEFDCTLAGKLKIIDIENRKGYTLDVDEKGKFSIPVPFSKKYKVEYENSCSGRKYKTYIINENCPDADITANINFKMDDVPNQFRLDDFQVPFFVTGYWKPNTLENLAELVKTFETKSQHISCCISDPITEFDENLNRIYYSDYCDSVNSILDAAKNYILTKLKMYDCKCKKCTEGINLTIIGYTDPRKIECKCIYNEPSIDDFNRQIKTGTEINNSVLSELRAYHIANTLRKLLEKEAIYRTFVDKINWKVEGGGVLEDNTLPNKYRRSADIRVECNTEIISGK